jgi:hypothetical protein
MDRTYSTWTVWINLPDDVRLDDVIKEGLIALHLDTERLIETDYVDTVEY